MWGAEGSDVAQDESENDCDQSGMSKTGCGNPAASDSGQGRQQRPDERGGAGIATEVDEVRYGLLVTRCVT